MITNDQELHTMLEGRELHRFDVHADLRSDPSRDGFEPFQGSKCQREEPPLGPARRGRRAWTDSDLAQLADLRSSGEVAVDPSLVALDHIPREAVRPSEFALSTLDLTPPATADEKIVSSRHGRRGKRRRLKRSRRREIFAAIALSVLVMFAIVLLGLTGSCVGSPAPL